MAAPAWLVKVASPRKKPATFPVTEALLPTLTVTPDSVPEP
jgi:hypothetical protein